MRKGDIVLNPWVPPIDDHGRIRTTAFFIYIRRGSKYVQGLQLTPSGSFEEVLYYTADFKPTAKRKFKVVGHTKIFKVFAQELVDIAMQEGNSHE